MSLLALMPALLFAACADSDPSLSPASESAVKAPRVVSLNPCLDAILVELAAPEQILALSHYSHDASASSIPQPIARQFAITGGTAEEILALQPDIVLASSFIAPATKAALERLGLRVETFGGARSLEESLEQIGRLAALMEREAEGRELANSLSLDEPPAPTLPISALLWQPGQLVAGEASLVSEHLRWAGFSNHASARGAQQADYVSLENLIADPPDLVLIAGSQRGQRHPMLERLEATMVAPFDVSLLYCAGPTIPRARQYLLEVRAQAERFQAERARAKGPRG